MRGRYYKPFGYAPTRFEARAVVDPPLYELCLAQIWIARFDAMLLTAPDGTSGPLPADDALVVCTFCPGFSGTCCVCDGTRRISFLRSLELAPTVGVAQCGRCTVCKVLVRQARAQVAA